MILDQSAELPKYRKGTRNLSLTERALADLIVPLAADLYERGKLTREQAADAAVRLLGDLPDVLLQRAHAFYDAHADLTWRQAVELAGVELGHVQLPSTA
ncbi:hypothetical protein [Kitasatospora griseola]|uniref:hypothetical protein n=1 Tax=Kitasatospora griseola TaxID=2064 RepID=UPI00343943A2